MPCLSGKCEACRWALAESYDDPPDKCPKCQGPILITGLHFGSINLRLVGRDVELTPRQAHNAVKIEAGNMQDVVDFLQTCLGQAKEQP